MATFNGGPGDDSFAGGIDADFIYGNGANDSLSGGDGNDIISGDAGLDTLDGGAGSDTVMFETAPGGINLNLATGIASNNGEGQVESVTNFENAHGSYHNDVIQMSDSNGYVFARAGNDSITGGIGSDHFIGGSGNDTLNGGLGIDLADYGALTFDGGIDGFQGAVVDLTAGTATDNWGNTDSLSGIENLIGSVFNDNFTGDLLANSFIGNDGSDTLFGLDGNDSLTGGLGNDSLDGGIGNDQLRADEGDDTIQGGDGNDYITGGTGNDSIVGGLGTDTSDYYFTNPTGSTSGINASLLSGLVTGGEGNDTLSGIENINGTNFNDTITGDGFGNFLEGRAGNDSLIGNDGNDNLQGGDGNDSLYGGNGDDRLVGGFGNEAIMDGGAGYDVVSYSEYLGVSVGGGYIFNYSFQGANGYSNIQVTGRGANPASFEQDNGVIGIEQINGTAGDDIMRDLGDNRELEFQGLRGNDVIVGSPFDGFLDFAIYTELTSATTHIEVDLDPLQFNKYLIGGNFYGNLAVVSGNPIATEGVVTEVDSLQGIGAIIATGGADLILGSNRPFEFFRGMAGNDTIDGRGGFDVVDYGNIGSGGSGISITLAAVGLDTTVANDGTGGVDTLRNVEGIHGTNSNDTITGNEADNRLRGRAGSDTLDGAGGFDEADYNNATTGLNITLAEGNTTTGVNDGQGGTDTLINIEGLRGGAFSDMLTGNSAANTLFGRDGDDTFTGGGGNDTMDGQGGFDFAFYNNLLDVNGYNLVLNNATSTLSVTGKGGNSGYTETDTLYSIDVIGGTAFNDTMTDAVAGRVTYFGAYLGNDTITGNAADYDFAIYSERDLNVNVNANLGTGVVTVTNDTDGGYLETDTLTDIRGIWGGAGTDSLTGGAADEYFRGYAGNDTIDGGAGVDFADFRTGSAVTVTLAESGDTVVADGLGGTDTLRNIEALSGSGSNDIFTGNSLDNRLRGRGGNDVIDGGGGIDAIIHNLAFSAISVDLSGSVNNVQDGEGGTDSVTNVENVLGGDYNDTIKGSTANNSIEGGKGDDTLMGREGNDTLDGTSGFDRIDYSYLTDVNGYTFTVGATTVAVAGKGANSAYTETDNFANIDGFIGTTGNDTLADTAAGHQSYFQGSLGNDTIIGNKEETDFVTYFERGSTISINANLATGVATITDSSNLGLFETDTLVNINGFLGGLNSGNDTITGNSLNNWLRGSGGSDTIDGGTGFDVASYSNSLQGIQAVMAEAGLSFNVFDGINGTDTLSNIDGIGGTNYDDWLQGNSSDNYFRGENGFDFIDGGAGMDWAEYSSSEKAVNITLAEAGQTIVADDGYGASDILVNIEGLYGSSYNDTLTGNSQNNVFRGNEGYDTLDGLGGTDIVRYTTSHAGVTVALAAAGVDTIVSNDGFGGIDTLRNIENIHGSNFNDNFSGNELANDLQGRMGNDTLRGNGGNDSLDGETGIDRAVYTGNKADYTITFDSITGSYSVADSVGGRDGTDTLKSIEALQFADVTTVLGSITVDPRGTYLSTIPTDAINTPTTVLLADLGLAPGDVITLTRSGDYQAGIGGGFADDRTSMLAVFTDGTNFVAPDTYLEFISPVQGGAPFLPTDVGQDFFVAGGITTVKIPVGATTLRLSVSDSFFQDNTDPDGDYAVTVRKLDGGTSYAGADIIFGTTGNDTLSGGLGNDTLWGGNGDDSLLGQVGGDNVHGGAGNDTLDGGVALDRINGTDYNSTSYFYSTGAVTINLAGITGDGDTGSGSATGDASVGTDIIKSVNLIQGSNHNDTITGSTAVIFEHFEGGAGDDSIDGGVITDTLNADNANRASYQNTTGAGVVVDLIAGTAVGQIGSNAGNDTLANISQVRGSSFADTLLGSNRSDFSELFEGRDGNDSIDGRGGFDLVRFESATAGVTVNLATGTSTGNTSVGTDTFTNIEGVLGSNFNDVLTGGLAANGTIIGDGLSEFFRGNGGNDTIDGGQGYDTSAYNNATAAVVATLNDTLDGSATGDASVGTDVLRNIEALRGSAFNDTLTGSDTAAFESFEGREGNDSIDGKGGTDRVDYFFAKGGVTVNLTTGTASDGYGGTDTLLNIENVRGTRDFNDSVTGSAGNNRFETLGGNDTINGGLGFDTAVFTGAKAGYTVTRGVGSVTVSGADGVDVLTGIEKLQFGDGATFLNGGGADFNGDGVGDLLWRNTSVGANSIWKGANNTTTQAVLSINDPNWKILGTSDFNGDGTSDILWRNVSTGANTIWLAGNSATVQAVTSIADLTWKVAGVGDFNGDGAADILWRNAGSGANVIWRNGNSANVQNVLTIADPTWKAAGIGDFNGDGVADILWRNTGSGANTIWQSANSTTTQAVTAIADQAWKVAAIGDFNGDGVSDILWRHSSSGANTLWRGGNSANVQAVTAIADQTWQVAGSADYNGDGVADILWRNSSSGADVIWNSGNSATVQNVLTVADQAWTIQSQTNTWAVASASMDRDFDFNGDGKSDVLWRNTATGADAIWLAANNATQQAVITVADLNWKMAGFADFNGDGKDDILWRHATSGANSIWNAGNSATTIPTVNIPDLNWKVAGLGDFNGDGKDDILWRNTATGADSIWNAGTTGGAAIPIINVVDQNWKVAGIGDFNADGKDDVLWRHFGTGANAIWNGANSATQLGTINIPDQAWQVAGVADFNGDGKDDILWRNNATGANSIWNAGTTGGAAIPIINVADLNWKVAGVGDYNGDGKADVAWRHATTGADAIWNGANNATPLTLIGVADLNWSIPEQTNTWVNSAGNYAV